MRMLAAFFPEFAQMLDEMDELYKAKRSLVPGEHTRDKTLDFLLRGHALL